jgi:hypothetical protein
MDVTREPKPLKTESTIIKAATPIVIPAIEINEMIEIKLILCLESKYLLAMKDSIFIN